MRRDAVTMVLGRDRGDVPLVYVVEKLRLRRDPPVRDHGRAGDGRLERADPVLPAIMTGILAMSVLILALATRRRPWVPDPWSVPAGLARRAEA